MFGHRGMQRRHTFPAPQGMQRRDVAEAYKPFMKHGFRQAVKFVKQMHGTISPTGTQHTLDRLILQSLAQIGHTRFGRSAERPAFTLGMRHHHRLKTLAA